MTWEKWEFFNLNSVLRIHTFRMRLYIKVRENFPSFPEPYFASFVTNKWHSNIFLFLRFHSFSFKFKRSRKDKNQMKYRFSWTKIFRQRVWRFYGTKIKTNFCALHRILPFNWPKLQDEFSKRLTWVSLQNSLKLSGKYSKVLFFICKEIDLKDLSNLFHSIVYFIVSKLPKITKFKSSKLIFSPFPTRIIRTNK